MSTTETPAALTVADEGAVSTSGDDTFCIEMYLDDSESIPDGAPASEPTGEVAISSDNNDSDPSALGVVTEKKWANGRTLTVCFFDGSATLKQKVQNNANLWTQFANIKFHFIAGRDADIRVTFSGNGGPSHSYVGTDNARIPRSQSTMTLGFSDITPDDRIRRTTIHEFGHALGAIHEHSQPNSNIRWNKQKVIDDHKGVWDQATVEHNIFFKYSSAQVQSSAFDKFSIMLYPIPPSWTYGTFTSNWNNNLSDTDKAFMSRMYPRHP